MKTFAQLKNFCEKNNIRYEVNTLYGKPYEYPSFENGKVVWKESRTILGFEIGMCNIAGRKGKSEWQWVWFETILCPETLEDNTEFWFRERYSQINGKSYKGWRESFKANDIIEKRIA